MAANDGADPARAPAPSPLPDDPEACLAAEWFDGRSARAQPVRLRLDGAALQLEPLDGTTPRRYRLTELTWPERQRHGPRHLPLPDGGGVVVHDGAAWDRWQQRQGLREPLVVRLQQSWRGTLAAAVLLVGLAVVTWAWGLPWAGRQTVAWLPLSVDQAVGEVAFESLQARGLFTDSRLPPAHQTRLRAALARAVEAADPPAQRPAYRLRFHASRLGPNALALPDGTIVLTDALALLFADDDAVIVGVLAHELGHVRARHGLRSLVQVGLLGAVTGLAFGDFSSLVAGSAALVGQLAYSRDFEREADAESIRVLQAAGIDPAVMVRLFQRLGEARGEGSGPSLGIALASHPADAERIARFRSAGPGTRR